MEKISEELIIRFFKGELDQKDSQTVLRYLEEDTEAALKYTGSKEWDDIKPSDFHLSKERSMRMLAKIRSATYGRPLSQTTGYKWAIAASLILIMAVSLIFFKSGINDDSSIALIKEIGLLRSEKNFSDSTKSFVLPDGSSVELAPRSEISYSYPFPADKRELRLSGQGLFKVARDEKKPFTVLSGNLATTALGTEFTINAFPGRNLVNVKLHEGKVMVKRLKGTEVFYLVPDQELTYENATGGIVVNSFAVVSETRRKKSGLLKVRQTGVSISFDRELLKNVFDQLEKSYHINIKYPEDGLKDSYFTGNFNETDSLERVLRVIAETNELEIIKTPSSYKIVKKR